MPNLRPIAAAAVAATALASIASTASAVDVCIAPIVTDSLAACNGFPALAKGATHSASAPPAVPPPPVARKATATPLPDPKLSAAEMRRGLANAQSIQLLTTQIQGLETLLAATAARAGDRPGLLRRLGDSYVELEAAQFRRKTEARISADDAKRKDASKVAGYLADAAKAEKIEGAARQAAIKHYGELKAKHPSFCTTPGAGPGTSSGCLDETLYDLAYEHEQAGDLTQARQVYLELINSAPGSKYVSSAYLAFGELFFQEAASDPSKWTSAEQAYKEVLRFPPQENKVFGYASYKLAYVYWNKGDFAQALGSLKRTIDTGASHPTASPAALVGSARRDLLPLYALAGDPKKSFDFLHGLSGDGASETTRTFAMMADLGQGYLDVGHYKEAVDLYQDLERRDRGPKSCAYHAHLTEAVLALSTGNKPAAKAELDRQIQVSQRFASEAHTDAEKLACDNVTASLTLETAMIWHLEAIGSGNVRGTSSPETIGFSADLYDKVLKQFPGTQFARFEFPRLVKQDWPTRLKVAMSRADLLYGNHEWAACGPAFDAVVDEDPKGALASEAAYASALCYQHAYLAAHPGRPERVKSDAAAAIAPRDFAAGEKAMLRSFDRFLCVAKPDARNKEALENYLEVEAARARVYFDAHHWAEAAAAFRPLAVSRPYHEGGVYAAQLYLEALNVMFAHGAAACVDDMAKDLPLMSELQCGGDRRKANAEGCGSIARVERDVVRQKLERDAKALVGPGHEKGWEAVAEGYMKIWNGSGEPSAGGRQACETKQPGCERMDEVLTNAARAFGAARLLAKSIAVRSVLVDPKYNLDARPLARYALREIGRSYQGIAVYDEAASFFERFAQKSPEHAEAAASLEDAIVLRLGLGQEDRALEDAELFKKSYGGKHPALAAQIGFAIGAHQADHDELADARKRLFSAMVDVDRSATPDVQIQAHAVLGRVLARTGSASQAAAEYAKVRALFHDPDALAAKMKSGDDGDDARKLGRVLSAVGEALYFVAAEKQKKADAIRFPEYHGSGRRDDVLAHVRTKVAEWVHKKRAAIDEAEKEYIRVVELRPVAPPKWVVASGARVGQMWSKFVAEFRAAPIPKEWKQNGPSPFGINWEELRAAYYEELDRQSEPFKMHAKAAFETCMKESLRFQYFDEGSRGCEAWLSKNYATEYHRMDELRGAASRVSMRIDGTPAVLAP